MCTVATTTDFLQNPGPKRRLPTCCVVVGMLTVCVGTVIVVAVEFLLFRVLDCARLVLLSEVRVVVAVAVLEAAVAGVVVVRALGCIAAFVVCSCCIDYSELSGFLCWY